MDEEGEHRSFDVIWKFHSSIGSVIIHTRKSSECDMYPSLPPQFTNGNPPIVYTKTEPGHLQQIYATAWKTIQDLIHELVRYWMTKMNADHLLVLYPSFGSYTEMILEGDIYNSGLLVICLQ